MGQTHLDREVQRVIKAIKELLGIFMHCRFNAVENAQGGDIHMQRCTILMQLQENDTLSKRYHQSLEMYQAPARPGRIYLETLQHSSSLSGGWQLSPILFLLSFFAVQQK